VEFEFNLEQKSYHISIQQKNQHYNIKIDDQLLELDAIRVTPNCIMLSSERGTHRIYLASTREKTYVHFNGQQYVVEHPEEQVQTTVRHDTDLVSRDSGICAPMPGKILKILVEQNQQVELKQNLVIVEAMKMEHNIRSPRNGIVKKIYFKEGDLVDAGQEILELEFDTENKND